MLILSKNYKKYIKYYKNFNNSKLLAGLSMIILNLFSKHIELKLSKNQEEYIKHSIGREILIFTVLFVGTHDIIISILLTAAFIILANTVFNEKSKFCLMPDKYRKLEKELDTNKDNIVSEKEIEDARKILQQANMQNNKFINNNL